MSGIDPWLTIDGVDARTRLFSEYRRREGLFAHCLPPAFLKRVRI